MDSKRAVELAKNYVLLSNNHNLACIKPLFSNNASYHSAYFGEYQGIDAIYAMMASFFSRFPDAHWEVNEYRNIDNNGVEFMFNMTGVDSSCGKRINRHGLERVYFTADGLIHHIAVCRPDIENIV
ncbi:MAG: nuclear transport factor 2 family protein [Nitrosomonas sp.]|nr:MAG: nuclear transport factor 2 family protein [Nitrosomonas sp.]